MHRYSAGIIIVLILTLTLFGGEETSQGKTAPDFILKDLSGDNYRLSGQFGKGPIVINFWATWCIPCIEELKQMKRIYEKYESRQVEFLAISVDDPKTVGRVTSFVKSHRYPFKILLDTNSNVMHLYQSEVPPYTVLIDTTGKIVYSHLGYRLGDEREIEKQLNDLLENDANQ